VPVVGTADASRDNLGSDSQRSVRSQTFPDAIYQRGWYRGHMNFDRAEVGEAVTGLAERNIYVGTSS